MRDGGPITGMHQRQVAVLLWLERSNLAREAGDEVVIRWVFILIIIRITISVFIFIVHSYGRYFCRCLPRLVRGPPLKTYLCCRSDIHATVHS